MDFGALDNIAERESTVWIRNRETVIMAVFKVRICA